MGLRDPTREPPVQATPERSLVDDVDVVGFGADGSTSMMAGVCCV